MALLDPSSLETSMFGENPNYRLPLYYTLESHRFPQMDKWRLARHVQKVSNYYANSPGSRFAKGGSGTFAALCLQQSIWVGVCAIDLHPSTTIVAIYRGVRVIKAMLG